jgi:FADH2 O2-dependent halogenase
VRDWLAEELGAEDAPGSWRRLLERFPSIGEHFEGSEAVRPFVSARRLPYRCATVAGEGFALLPSAAGFVDPFYSTGFPLTLLGIHRLGRLFREHGAWLPPAELEAYAALTRQELEDSTMLVEGSYELFPRFTDFAALSMIYFAAASYAEMARRLDRGYLANRFLLGNRDAFRSALHRHCGAAIEGRPSAFDAIRTDLEPFNIAGLCEPEKRNWYGVDLEDVVRGAAKLECSAEEVREFFARMGW